jgi:hypothetical protein
MLNLVLTYHWYDKVEAGNKPIEYRAMSPKWKRDIWEKRDTIKRVRLQRAYTKTHLFKDVEKKRAYTKTHLFKDVEKIDIGQCPYDGWDDNYYRIHFAS